MAEIGKRSGRKAQVDLLAQYGPGASVTGANSEVARRSTQKTLLNPLGKFKVDTLTKFMIDREVYGATPIVSLFRLFLEPLGEPVDACEMSISGNVAPHTHTYTFADGF